MRYSTPELTVLGPARDLVQGDPEGHNDNGDPTVMEHSVIGVALGLDD